MPCKAKIPTILVPPAKRNARCRAFRFKMPSQAQLGVLDLPTVKHYLECRRRVWIVEAALRLQSAGISGNQTAHILGVPIVTLWTWQKKFARGGAKAFFPKSRHGRPGPNSRALCTLKFILRT